MLRSVFSPHSHDAAASIDPAVEASGDGIRALRLSLAGLAITALLQLLIVLVTGSVALLADTFHNFTDALTAAPLWIAFSLARRAPTRRFTHGYGRAEELAGIFIVAMIALSAGVAAWESIHRLLAPQEITNVGWVVVAGVIGFAGNELVALYRIRVGRAIGSAALVADGLHARTDGLTSLAVVAGALGVAAGYPVADPIVGLLISVAILFVLKGAATSIYHRMMDGVDPALVDRVERVLLSTDGIESIDTLRLRWIGHELRAEAEVVSDFKLSLSEAHAIAERARHRLFHEVPRLTQAIIHTSPNARDGRDHHAELAHHLDPS
ncbi:MAG: cation diffusion facilitator family transporter [Actinomycetota bacterium]